MIMNPINFPLTRITGSVTAAETKILGATHFCKELIYDGTLTNTGGATNYK